MPSVPRSPSRFVSRPLTRRAGVLAAAMVVLILLGCMSISIGKFGGGSCAEADGVFCQEGEVTLPPNTVREVFYPVPYANRPNLEISDLFSHGELLEQKEVSFKVRNETAFAVTLSWKARGVRVISPTPEPTLTPPPAPVPVDGAPPAETTGKAG
jgi:hypothetical protein